ncbi:MAG: nucleotidyl transferase AbiEii/AbiGii toxin family protein [Deltaproteobacteria bacterium]|nr:nucleotidyl transferase AbiEii/AbiGii toxin family protein [Deltaproteobacteria bacterium]
MTAAQDLNQTISRIVSILFAEELPFHLTGGLASSFYGEPRFTQDIDIVIRISDGKPLQNLLTKMSPDFLVDAEAAENAVLSRGIFQALDEQTMIKVDFHIGEAIHGELERSKQEEILPGIIVPLVSKEDAILSKLLWIKKGSHKSRQDVKMMLTRTGAVDFHYLNSQAERLGVSELLLELRSERE